jgi:AcrR family transcriptional regulator
MTPRSDAEFEKIREQSKMKIIVAALEIFAQRGYVESTIEEIAQKANVAKGLIYNYFTSKEELLTEAFLNSLSEADNAMSRMIEISDPVTAIEMFIDGFYQIAIGQLDLWRLQSSILINPRTPERLREAIMSKIAEYCRFIAELFKKCNIENPESQAWVFAATLDGLILYYMFLGDRLKILECISAIKLHYRLLIESST